MDIAELVDVCILKVLSNTMMCLWKYSHSILFHCSFKKQMSTCYIFTAAESTLQEFTG